MLKSLCVLCPISFRATFAFAFLTFIHKNAYPRNFYLRFTDGFTALFINHVNQISERRFL